MHLRCYEIVRNFREYKVWQDAMQLVNDVYQITKHFPVSETFAISNQIQRAVVSIPSNIAEGSGRKTEADFVRFLDIALGSTFEVETQVLIAQSLGYIDANTSNNLVVKIQTIEKELTTLINTVIQ